MSAVKALRLGEVLVQRGAITQDQLRIAIKEQQNNGLPIGRQLILLGFVTEALIRDQLANTGGHNSIDLSNVIADAEALGRVPQAFARRHYVLPIAFDAETQTLTIAITDMFNVVALDQLRALIGTFIEIELVLASEAQLLEAVDKFYGFELTVGGILDEIETGEIDYQSLALNTNNYTQPVVRLIEALLVDAVKHGASDIHFEPEQAFLRIRYRIDGVLEQIRVLHHSYWPAMAVRLKVMSGMNIAENRAPQDGRFSLTLHGRPIDFRASVQPTMHGENIVLRILDRERAIMPLARMNLPADTMTALLGMLARPEGVVIVTGPTGSGKTTTLYSLLNHVNDEAVNIMTLEDPVEYPVDMMRQTSMNETIKLDFANGIRSIMRQDPDIILVGEIRDHDTAQMAFRAAMTGHQVFTTLHTNSALGVFPRLLDIGIVPDIMAGNIIGVIAQRLVRVLCSACRVAYVPEIEQQHLLGWQADSQAVIYRAAGCPICKGKGYRGRMALMELLSLDHELDELVAHKASQGEIRALALTRGYRTLADEGIAAVMAGKTSLAEVARVIDLTRRL